VRVVAGLKQDVGFEVDAVNGKAVTHRASTSGDLAQKQDFGFELIRTLPNSYQGTSYMYITISVVWINRYY